MTQTKRLGEEETRSGAPQAMPTRKMFAPLSAAQIEHELQTMREARASRRALEARPLPEFRQSARLMFLFGGTAIALLVVLALWGNALPFDFACDLTCVMLAAIVAALAMLVIEVVADCRATKNGGAK